MRDKVYHRWILKKYRLREIYGEDRAGSCVHHIAFTGLEFDIHQIVRYPLNWYDQVYQGYIQSIG